jgi:hypothetical protein
MKRSSETMSDEKLTEEQAGALRLWRAVKSAGWEWREMTDSERKNALAVYREHLAMAAECNVECGSCHHVAHKGSCDLHCPVCLSAPEDEVCDAIETLKRHGWVDGKHWPSKVESVDVDALAKAKRDAERSRADGMRDALKDVRAIVRSEYPNGLPSLIRWLDGQIDGSWAMPRKRRAIEDVAKPKRAAHTEQWGQIVAGETLTVEDIEQLESDLLDVADDEYEGSLSPKSCRQVIKLIDTLRTCAIGEGFAR